MTQQTNPAPLLAVENLKKSYLIRGGRFGRPTARKQALAGVSFTLGPGLYGLLGPNGAGKSTLINIITGSLKQDSGTVQWCGKSARALDIRFRRALGYMPQQQGLYDSYTGRRFLAYMCALKEIPSKDVPADPKERVRLRELLAEMAKDRIILVATHVVSDVETVATEILLLKNGKLVDKAPVERLIETYAPGQNLEAVYLAVFGEEDGK